MLIIQFICDIIELFTLLKDENVSLFIVFFPFNRQFCMLKIVEYIFLKMKNSLEASEWEKNLFSTILHPISHGLCRGLRSLLFLLRRKVKFLFYAIRLNLSPMQKNIFFPRDKNNSLLFNTLFTEYFYSDFCENRRLNAGSSLENLYCR